MIDFTGVYLQAITHSSYVKEYGGKHNEVLEFSGDAVLQLCVSDLLLELYPDSREGDLTRMRHQLVNNETLAEIAIGLDLGSILRLGKGEEASGGRTREKTLANVVEALLGALYVEQGLEAAQFVIRSQLSDKAKQMATYIPAKQRLHEWTQQRYNQVPLYQLVKEFGPAHQRSFVMGVSIDGKVLATGVGHSKKKASILAAEQAVQRLQI